MLRRLVIGLCFCFFLSASMAATDNEELTQTVFELERSVAILQLSKASLDDYQVMSEKMTHIASLESRVDFLSNVTFLLCVALLIFFFQLRRQQKRLAFLELNSKA